MNLDDLTLGAYHPGCSLLHRLDPRLKLVGFPLLAVAAFSAGPARLAGLALLAVLLLPLAGVPWRRWWRSVRVLRWILFFSIVVHLLFSPGRTLGGIAWLSLDGLERGLLIAGQLVLALTFSSLLAFVTPPRHIAAALASLLAPWRRHPAVREMVLLFLLMLRFIPILREETAAQLAVSRAAGDDPAAGGLTERLRRLGRLIAPLVLRLVDRADALAGAAARGEDVWGEKELPILQPRVADRWALAAGTLVLVLLFGVLK